MDKTMPTQKYLERLTFLIRRCGRELYYNSEPGLQQAAVLQILAEKPVTQKQVQERLGTCAASVSELISKLEAKGCLVRQRSGEDRRTVLLTLTEKGVRVAGRHSQERPAAELFSALSEKEQLELIALLEKMLGAEAGNGGETT